MELSLLILVYIHKLYIVYLEIVPISGVGVRLKAGDKYWKEWRGGVWGGAVSSPVWGLGACPQKKINFALKIMQFWASFGTSFLYYSRKWGGLSNLSPSPESGGDLSPCPPCSDAYDNMSGGIFSHEFFICLFIFFLDTDVIITLMRYSVYCVRYSCISVMKTNVCHSIEQRTVTHPLTTGAHDWKHAYTVKKRKKGSGFI